MVMPGPRCGALALFLPQGRSSVSSRLTESGKRVDPSAGSSRALLSPHRENEVKGPTPLKVTKGRSSGTAEAQFSSLSPSAPGRRPRSAVPGAETLPGSPDWDFLCKHFQEPALLGVGNSEREISTWGPAGSHDQIRSTLPSGVIWPGPLPLCASIPSM